VYCPQCAAQNAEGAKFCRSCGLKLETVALALSGESAKAAKKSKHKSEPQTAEEWIERRIKGVKDVMAGSILLGISILIGVALALFVPHQAPWVFVWIVFFGWMACWGGIEIANGLGNLFESKSRLRLLEGKASATDSTPHQLSSPGTPVTITNSRADFGSSLPLSVTEGTTRHLNEPSKD
jgi:zinc ribbon protein